MLPAQGPLPLLPAHVPAPNLCPSVSLQQHPQGAEVPPGDSDALWDSAGYGCEDDDELSGRRWRPSAISPILHSSPKLRPQSEQL